jgi:serine protease
MTGSNQRPEAKIETFAPLPRQVTCVAMRRQMAMVIGGLILMGGAAVAAAPSDPGWPQQWHLAKIRADKAWARSKGVGVIVAVVDTGVDLEHPDLRGRLVSGKDYVDGGAPQDDNGHGTFMAGLIAATTGNGIGVASVAPSAKIMPIRALGEDGSGEVTDVANGIRWAVDHGANIINLSLAQENIGGGGSGPQNLLGNPLLDVAIKEAAADGALVIVAAGNDFTDGGASETAYDATVPGVLVIGAGTRSDRRAAYSNYGSGLDLLAPGGGSSSDPAAACKDNDPVVSTFWDPKSQDSGYGAGCGTSMAVAHVSGVGALLMSRGYSAAAAAKQMLSTAVDLGPNGRDDSTGYGRVDALAAVGASSPPPTTSQLQVDGEEGYDGRIDAD